MFRIVRRKPSSRVPIAPEMSGPPSTRDVADAWKTLSLVNEWIRHSDAKAGIALAFVGALATMLFNLVGDFHERSAGFDVLVFSTCFLLLVGGILCGWTLTPRVRDTQEVPESTPNRLFFVSIAREYNRREYREALNRLTLMSDSLLEDLADQIHANARISTIKSRCAKWAIRAVLSAALCVALIAAIVGMNTR